MTQLQVRTAPSQADAGADVLLDWFDDQAASTVRCKPDFMEGLAPSPVARDLLRLGGAVYCTDKVVKRSGTPDAWTRDLSLQVPVSDVTLWDAAKSEFVKALSFLSGDHWDLNFVADTVAPPEAQPLSTEYDGVSLFSGGLDSLAGVIDLLEAGRQLVLVGHHDSSLTDHKQTVLHDALRRRYGADRLTLRHLYLRPAAPRAAQARPLPRGKGENTTRGRSFLFFAAGVAVADALGATEPLYVPENGFIGINVPLTPARAGSLSTRTTHPLYMQRMRTALDLLGLHHPIENPYRLLTKGEALEQSANRKLLLRLAPQSVSCSHPEAPRWAKRPQGNCGYCYPCLIRRASMHRIGSDKVKGNYAWDALTDADLLRRSTKRGRSLRALTASLGQDERTEDVLINGRIPNGETAGFFDVYCRGRAELRAWLTGAGPELRRRLR
jgi:7-cyano-7-deazaguanine synthase in queuosine biosynthesis